MKTILAKCKPFFAMHSDRIYRKGLSHEQIAEEFKRGNGTQFDPTLLPYFVALFEEGELDKLEQEHPAPSFVA